jgi:Pyridoxamine 5'-phosphate oxidase
MARFAWFFVRDVPWFSVLLLLLVVLDGINVRYTVAYTHERGPPVLLDEERPLDATAAQPKATSENPSCPCREYEVWQRPDVWKKAETARWMAHSIEWGVLTTLSSRSIDIDAKTTSTSSSPVIQYPFGNVYSFIDGPCDNATGTPYFYGSFMDQSLKDIVKNPVASLTLSEASLASSPCWNHDTGLAKACAISALSSSAHSKSSHGWNHEGSKYTKGTKGDAWSSGDPESPLCARLTLTGRMVQIPNDSSEFTALQEAFFQRHGQMQGWPVDHEWVIFALNIVDVWLIDYFGGATILTADQYYSVSVPTTGKSSG